MRYITWEDVVNRYSDIAKDGWSEEKLTPMMLDAEAEVDSRLAPRYTVPFDVGSNAPQIVRTLSVDLTYYRVNWMNERSEKLKSYIDERFKALLDGTMSLTTSGGEVEDIALLASTDRDHRSSFGPDDPSNWRTSENWIDQVQSEREYD